MSEERLVKRLCQKTAEGSGSVGRTSLRWMDDVGEGLRRMGVTRKVLRPATSTQVFLGFPVSISKF